MSPLRVLHVAPYSPDAWAYGGIPRVLGALARAQAGGGHVVTVATTDVCDETSRLRRSSRSPRRRIGPWRERWDEGVEAVIFPNVSNRLAHRCQFYQPVGLGRFLRRHGREFDLAHLHACHNLPTAIAARVLRRAGVPCVVQPNGTAPRIEQRRAAKAVFDFLFARRLLQEAAAVIAVSRSEERQLAALGLEPGRCHLVPNPLSPAPDGRADRDSFRHRLGLTTDPLVLFLGMLSPRKHPRVLAEAVARLPMRSVQLVFAGPDRGAETATRRAVQQSGIEGRVRFAGLLRGDDRFRALSEADVVVYASSDEVFGLAALEALQAGTPVVVGDDGGCGEVVAEVGGGMTVAPGDSAALAAALAQVLGNLPAWKAAASRAGATAAIRFHPDAVWARLETVYRGVTGRVPIA